MEDVLVERPAERVAHLGVRPVRQVQELEATGQALGQSACDQQGCRAEQHHLERNAMARVVVPQPLGGLGPARDLLNLVEHEHGTRLARVLREQACGIPLLSDPLHAAQRGLVGACDPVRQTQGFHHLLHQCALTHLARTGHHVQETAGLGEAAQKQAGLRALVGHGQITQYSE